MVSIIKGDILKAKDRDIILQQVNCKGVMGSGLAKQIRNVYPNIFNEYKEFCKENTINKSSDLLGEVFYYHAEHFTIANCFGQDNYGGTGEIHTNYEALRHCFDTIKTNCLGMLGLGLPVKIGIPYKIGCGLGGGDWFVVYHMINDIFDNTGIDVIIYSID